MIFLDLPKVLPTANFTITTLDKFRYMANVCTFGYTYAFWGWSQWERHIDWMALNGINLPLAFTAQEAIWKRVWNKVLYRVICHLQKDLTFNVTLRSYLMHLCQLGLQ